MLGNSDQILGNFPRTWQAGSPMTDPSYDEFINNINEIASPRRLGFTLKEAFDEVSGRTGIGTRRLRRIWNRETKPSGEEILSLQAAARAAKALRRQAEEHARYVEAQKTVIHEGRNVRTASILAADAADILATLQVVQEGLAALRPGMVGREIVQQVEAVRGQVLSLASAGPVLGQPERPMTAADLPS